MHKNCINILDFQNMLMEISSLHLDQLHNYHELKKRSFHSATLHKWDSCVCKLINTLAMDSITSFNYDFHKTLDFVSPACFSMITRSKTRSQMFPYI